MARDANAGLFNFKQRLRKVKHAGDSGEMVFVHVIGIFRYCLDPDFKTDTGVDPEEETAVYDLLITDKKYKLKCLLDPKENLTVHQGRVTCGTTIAVKLSACSLHYNDTNLAGTSYVILHSLTIQPVEPLHLDPENIQFLPDATDCEKKAVPMATQRGCYLSQWCTEDPFGVVWKGKASEEAARVDMARITTVERLAATYRTASRPYPLLLVRVFHKSRLRWFGRPNKSDKLPYQVYLEVADKTGHCTAVLWTSMCTELYNRFQEGDVLLISNYTVREKYQLMSKPTIRNSNLHGYNLELSLNKHHPVTNVRIIKWSDTKPEWQLPFLQYNFVTRRQLSSMPDQYNCDVVGVVTYVGRYARDQKLSKRNETWLSRWLHLRDETSKQPFRVEVYSTSQPQEHKLILPGQVCVMTQLRVCHGMSQLQSSRQHRYLYLTTTNESQIYVRKENLTMPWNSSPVVKQLLGWLSTADGSNISETSGEVTGYYTYPPLPRTLAEYKAVFPEDKPLQITSTDSLVQVIDRMYFRERRRVIVLGFVLRVVFCPVVERNENRVVTTENSRSPDQSMTSATGSASSPSRASKRTCQMKTHASNKRFRPDNEDTNSGQNQPTVDSVKSPSQVEELAVTVDDLWPDVMDHVTTLGMDEPHPSFNRRRFQHNHGNEIQAALNMPASTGMKPHSCLVYSDLPVVGSSGYFSLTFLGLNQRTAVRTLFSAPSHCSQNATLLSMLSGESTEEGCGQTMVRLSESLVQQVVLTAKTCEQCQMLFVLDLYSHGEHGVEIVINRAYPVATN